MNSEATREELIRRIKILSEKLWENQCQVPDIEAWLNNFDGRYCGDRETERLHALHLLASVSFFGLRELRVLLKAMFRDLFRYPIVQYLRSQMGGTVDADKINQEFIKELLKTRFIGSIPKIKF